MPDHTPGVGEVQPAAAHTPQTGSGTHQELANDGVGTQAVQVETESHRPSKRARNDNGIENSVGGDGSNDGHGGGGGGGGGAAGAVSDVGGDVGRKLANLIKGHHAALRKRAMEEGAAAAWADNARREQELAEYSEAMYSLATTQWSAEAETRFTWCRDMLAEYFVRGGRQQAEAKDARRLAHHHPDAHPADNRGGASSAVRDGGVQHHVQSTRSDSASDGAAAAVERGEDNESATLSVPITFDTAVHSGALQHETTSKAHATVSTSLDHSERTHPGQHAAVTTLNDAAARDRNAARLRVLDVGSCYDPFSRASSHGPPLDVTAMDLRPASAAPPSVLSGDFLSVGITPRSEQTMLDAAAVEPTAAGSELHPSEQSSCVAVLKSGTGMGSARAEVASLRAYSCDAVVFCLLLSYMPTPALRLEACRRARALLRPSGLLLIVTPDSSHVGKAAARMKRWRASIEALGFRRWRYEKLTHAHCLAFRAVEPVNTPDPPRGMTAADLENGILLHCEL